MKQTAIFVVGMHRTGTSAITGILNILGLPLGNNPLPPHPDNPKGYFEEKDILAINEEFFSTVGRSNWWYEFFPIINPHNEKNNEWIKRIQELLIKKFSHEKIFVIKDPRLCYIFPLYEKACINLKIAVKVIMTLRSYKEIADSLFVRNQIDEKTAYRGILGHYSRANYYTKNHPRITVDYSETIENTDHLIERIKIFIPQITINKEKKKKVHEFITGDLRHHVSQQNQAIDFLGVGAQKSGTTTLWGILKQHPRIGISGQKEVHYFDYPDNFIRGHEWYEQQISPLRKENKIYGEITPYYLFHPGIPRKVHRLNPKIKVIAILRDPVERAWSHYLHAKRLGYENLSFTSALKSERKRLKGNQEKLKEDDLFFSYHHQHNSYRNRGYYLEQLNNWYRYFDKSQIKIIEYEDFIRNQKGEMQKVFSFLGINDIKFSEMHLNTGGNKKIPEFIKVILQAHFIPYNKKLSDEISISWDYCLTAKIIYKIFSWFKIDPLILLHFYVTSK